MRIGRPPPGTIPQDRPLAGTGRRFSRLARWLIEPVRELFLARQRRRARAGLRREPVGDHDRDPPTRCPQGPRHRLDLRPRVDRRDQRRARCPARRYRCRFCVGLGQRQHGRFLARAGDRGRPGRIRCSASPGPARRGGADRDAALAAGDREHLVPGGVPARHLLGDLPAGDRRRGGDPARGHGLGRDDRARRALHRARLVLGRGRRGARHVRTPAVRLRSSSGCAPG